MNIFAVQPGFNERGKQKYKSKKPVKSAHRHKNSKRSFFRTGACKHKSHACVKENDPLIPIELEFINLGF